MTILDQIVADTKGLVAERKRKTPMRSLEGMRGFERSTIDFAAALKQDTLAFISEVKKASPSKGVIRPDFDPVGIAEQYAEAGTAAISVLTEPLHFQGALQYLADVRRRVQVPLLRKDFIIDLYQLFEARAYGADAVLLIAAVLDKYQLYDFQQAAAELGLACLVELYEMRELDKLDFDQVRVLGVNNRDLRTFEVDIDHSLRVFAEAPNTVIKVAESGLKSAAELVYLRERGVDAVLIGETFMRAKHPGDALKQMRDELAKRLEDPSYTN